jgi:hypothetical protein
MSKYYKHNHQDILADNEYNNDNIYLIFQFFIPSNEERYNEIKYCLRRNIELNKFTKIILLNERIYTKEELGLNDSEMLNIKQVNIKLRMRYIDCFKQVLKLNLDGYIVIANSDIFFDDTISNVRRSCLSQEKSLYALIRFEYNPSISLNDCKLFTIQGTDTLHPGCQDTWIYHTKYITEINMDLIKHGIYKLGVPGCDSKIAMGFSLMGFKCINEPYNIRTYHYHTSPLRNYTLRDQLPLPYLYLEPIIRT